MRDPQSAMLKAGNVRLNKDIRRQLDILSTLMPSQADSQCRFDLYAYLEQVYETYRKWKDRKIAKRLSRLIARELNIPRTSRSSPIRILIEATRAAADPKQKSRWTRALQYADRLDVPIADIISFIRSRRGIAGCARLAAKRYPRRPRPRNDWD
jgi:hypothetical protein